MDVIVVVNKINKMEYYENITFNSFAFDCIIFPTVILYTRKYIINIIVNIMGIRHYKYVTALPEVEAI